MRTDKQSTNYGRYVFDNAAAQTPARFSALEEIFDPGTIRHLTELRVAEGQRCLEVGAGRGSIARWLRDRVGVTGHVLAIDIDTQRLDSLRGPNLEVRQHDIISDPLPSGAFDLVHVRLVLHHLPDREEVLATLVRALKPGGWLLAEEFDALSVMPDPAINPVEVLLPSRVALSQLMQDRGADLRYGRLLAARLRVHGLQDVGTEGRVFVWRGGSAGATLIRSNLEQMAGELIESGRLTNRQLEQDLSRLGNPEYVTPSPIMWAAWGRRVEHT